MPTHLTVKGLVIRKTDYGESSVLFDLLTDNGICPVSARGIRKAGSKYAAVTQVFSYGEFCLRQSGGKLYLDSAAPINLFYGLRADLEALALASYFSELIRKTATDQPQPQILRLFLHCLHYLSAAEKTRAAAQIKAIFELRLIAEHGMAPNLICCAECLTYQPPQPVMRLEQADFVCASCIEEISSHDLPVTPSALQAIRHVVFSEFDKLFAFRITGESLRQFSSYAERYIKHCLDMPLPALKYYHDLTDSALLDDLSSAKGATNPA